MTQSTALTTQAPPPPMDLIRWGSFREATQVADYLAGATMVPSDYQKQPANIIIAMDYAARLNTGLMAVMQGLAVINGRPTLWGDLMLAVCLRSPLCEYVHEHFDDEQMLATCKAKRVGAPDKIVRWSVVDARKAGLWGKKGPWSSYPKRMLGLRARAWALRNAFADVLLGLQCAEEVRDYAVGGSEAAACREPESLIDVPDTDKYVLDAEFEERPIAHADAARAEPAAKEEAQPRSALPGVLGCIARASTMDELSACKQQFGELTSDERKRAIEAGIAKMEQITAHEQSQRDESEQ